jgi:hypothetical protein
MSFVFFATFNQEPGVLVRIHTIHRSEQVHAGIGCDGQDAPCPKERIDPIARELGDEGVHRA